MFTKYNVYFISFTHSKHKVISISNILVYGDFQRLSKSFGNLYNSTETFKMFFINLWKSTETFGSLRNPLEVYGNLWKFFGNLWKSTETFKKFFGNLWKSTELFSFRHRIHKFFVHELIRFAFDVL